LVGWILLGGSAADLYDERDAMALFTLACVVGLGAFAWGGGVFANRLAARAEAHAQVLRTVVETALDAFILMDEKGCVLDWNPEAERMFGYKCEEALGRLVMDMVIPAPQRALHQAGLARFLTSGEGPVLHRRVEVTAQRRDGEEFPPELMIFPTQQDGTWFFSGFVRDLTESKRAEAQLRQAQKMEAVGQLTGGVAHDFNNLLTVVIVSLDNALVRATDEARSQIENALHAAERGAALIRELLAFSRKQTLAPERLDLNELAQGMLGMLNRLLGEHIEVDLKLAHAAWPALADKSQVETALLNLALNARDAMAEGGTLAIETANVTLDEDYCRRNGEVTPGDYVTLAVSDSGVGMTADVIERAFEPFYTTKEAGKGSGLGLAMIFGFAKQSRGHLKIYSEPGHGTTVRLYLPRAGANQEIRIPGSFTNDDATPGAKIGEVVLVVEDDADVRAIAVAQLSALGYGVLEAENGSMAMAIIETEARIDLLFTDVVMPGSLSGRQLAEAAATQRPALRTLFTSGYTDNSIVHHGRLDPGVHFLAKPYRARELARRVREVIDARGSDASAS
jgi:PAS domain S-box-containing protein